MASYGLAILRSQLLPTPGSAQDKSFDGFEMLFTAIFTAELAANLFGYWWRDFVEDAWQIFDTLVVVISLASIALPSLPAINVLRLLRVFKMVRLFRRLMALRILLNALSSSVIPVLYSFMILLLVTSLYAVLCTDLFGQIDYENFGTFSRSLFSLFQVATGDSWSSVIARGLMDSYESTTSTALVALFFVSYVLIVGVVLMNTCVAVLLDEFISTVANEKAQQEEAKLLEVEAVSVGQAQGPLDLLISSLMDYTTNEDLRGKIAALYDRLDLDESGGVEYKEMNEGFKAMGMPAVTKDDWELLSEKGVLLDSVGELSPQAFETMLTSQMQQYCRRKLVLAMSRSRDGVQADTLLSLKFMLSQLESISEKVLDRPEFEKRKRNLAMKRAFKGGLLKCFLAWKDHHQDCVRAEAEAPINLLHDRISHVEPTLGALSSDVRRSFSQGRRRLSLAYPV